MLRRLLPLPDLLLVTKVVGFSEKCTRTDNPEALLRLRSDPLPADERVLKTELRML